MKINAMMEVELFDDQAEEIFVEYLKKEYMDRVQNPLVVVPEDVVNNDRLHAAMAEVLCHYMTYTDYLKFVEEVHGE
jgi:hypothetical protein